MPALSTKTQHYYRERICSIFAQNPQTGIERITQRLSWPASNDHHYVGKLVGKIHTERAKRADAWMLNMALASSQDAIAEIARVG